MLKNNRARSSTLSGSAKLLFALAPLAALTAPSAALAQVYTSSQFAAPYLQLTGGTPVAFGSTDDDSTLVAIGFPFEYFGVMYTHINVATNGFAVLASPCTGATVCPNFGLCTMNVCEIGFASTGAPGPFPDTQEPNLVFAPFWDDLLVNTPAQVRTGLEGAAPNRTFVIEWRNVTHFGGGADTANFQVRLGESGTVRLAWGPTSGGVWSGDIGIEDATGTVGFTPTRPCTAIAAGCTLADLQALNGQVLEVGPVDGPELVGLVSPPPGGDPGSTIQVGVTARNIGTQTTTVSIVGRVYLSVDTAITPGVDTFLGEVTIGTVPSRGARTATLTTTLPAMLMPGRYRIGAIVDATNRVIESSESNNTAVGGEFLVGPNVFATVTAPASTGPSEPINVPVVIHSNGSPVQSVFYRMWFSLDATLDPLADTLVGTGTAAVAGAPQLTFNAGGVVPANIIPLSYFVIVELDPFNAIAELDETDNLAVSATDVDVIGPDVAVTEIDGAAAAYRGRPYTVRTTLRNIGGTTAIQFNYTFYLSDNQLVTATDPAICEFGPIDLAPGATLSVEHTCVVPPTIAPGPYYLGSIADSTTVVLEGDERNNIRFRRPTIDVRDPAPDFVVQELTVPALGAVGEAFVVGRTIDNIGNAPGSVDYTVYLSTDRQYDAADIEIGRGTRAIAENGRHASVDQVRVPLTAPAGVYSVIYRLDPAEAVVELDETNNTSISATTIRVDAAQLQILSRLLPQGTVGLPYQFDLAAVGGEGALTWSVTSGMLPSGVTLEASTGRLRGTPRATTRTAVQFRVDDGTAHAEATFMLLVAESTVDLEVITRAVPPAFIGRAYEIPLTAIGGIPPYVWTVDGMLPPGFQLSAEGILTGHPTVVGALPVNFRVRDAAMTMAERPITVRVIASEDALHFTADVLRDGTINRAYEDRFRARNGQAPYTFALVGGDLPGGMEIMDDKLVGTPTVAGTYIFAVRVSDQRADFDINRFVLTILPDEGVRFVSTALPNGLVGSAYVEEGGSTVRLKAVPQQNVMGVLAYTVIAGDLPPGLTLASDGVIGGSPTASGVYSFIAEVRDEANERDRRALAIVVEEPVIVIPDVVDTGCGCTTQGTGPDAASVLGLLLVAALAVGRRRRAAGLLATVLVVPALLAPQLAHAQTVPYFLQQEMAGYVPRTGTPLTFTSTDDSDAVVNIPFPFHFFANQYSTVNVGTNGFVAFSQSAASLDNNAFGTATTPNNLIAVFWDDLLVTSVQQVVEGAAPNRILIIQWVATRFGGGGNLAAQLWLYEGAAGRFELHYGTGSGASFSASVGFENDTGSVNRSWLTCSPNCLGTDLAALDGLVLRALQDGGPDVVAGSVTSPARTYAGTPFQVTGTMTSLHQMDVGPFEYAYELRPANGSAQGAVPLGTFGPITLTPYQTISPMDMVTIPVLTAPGQYRIALVVDPDDMLMEPDERNNSAVAANVIEVGERRPDFTAGRIIATPSMASPGDTVSVLVDVRNAGNLAGSAEWRLVLSPNRVISVDDTVVHTASVTLGVLGTQTSTVNVTLPTSLEPGLYYFGVLADPDDETLELSEVNNAVAAEQPVQVGIDFVEVATEALPGGYVGVEYSAFLRGAGGDGTYTWAVASGTLPAGLSLLPMAGEIRGRPTAAGRGEVTVRVTSAGRTAERVLTIDVAERTGPLTIVTRNLLPGVVGQGYPPADGGEQQRIRTVNASGEVTYQLTGGAPAGLELATDGLLFGMPRQRGVFDVVVAARDATSTATRTIPLTIVEPGRLSLIAANLPEAVLDEEFRFQLQAVGATSTVTFALGTNEVLPDGLTLTTAGLIIGVPQRVGTWRFSIEAREGTAVDSANFTIVVVTSPGFGITPSSLPVAVVGEPYDATLEARGGLAPLAWRLVISGTLPRGLRFEVEKSGARERVRFLGTAEAVPEGGVSSFLATVEDIAGRYAEQPLAIRVTEPPVVVPPLPIDEGGCSCATGPNGVAADLGLLLLVAAVMLRRRRI